MKNIGAKLFCTNGISKSLNITKKVEVGFIFLLNKKIKVFIPSITIKVTGCFVIKRFFL